MVEKVVIGDATLYLGDCLEILPTLGKVDCVITDPPYGVNFSGKVAKQRNGSVNRGECGYINFDDSSEYINSVVIPSIIAAIRIAGRAVVTPGTKSMWLYPEPDSVGAFYTAAGTGLSCWGFKCSQPILYYGKDPYLSNGKGARPDSMGQTYPNDANKTGHPCAKPVAQMLWLVERASMHGETILDPFMGSATTGVSCANLGRKFIGIEIEPRYFEIACKRIEQAQRQGKLFVDAPKAPEQEVLQI